MRRCWKGIDWTRPIGGHEPGHPPGPQRLREPPGTCLKQAGVAGRQGRQWRAGSAAGSAERGHQRRSAGIGARELLKRAGPEVAHIVNMVVLKQPRHTVAVGWPHRNLQQQVAVPQRLIVDL